MTRTETQRPFYITTPIYYINDAPHHGHAYTTVACDAIARAMRMRGRDVVYLTGTDEHGQKVAKAAAARGLEPQDHADRMLAAFKEAWKDLEIGYDDFMRTTESRHVAGVQELWRRVLAAGDIYKDTYRGPYCVGCEAFYPESQLVDGKCPAEGHPTEVLEEESYFFRLSKYQQPLLDHYRKHPEFVVPRTRLNEVVSFVEMGLNDLSVSRTKVSWGVPVPDDPDHVMYVWFDALSNYVTALGGPFESSERYRRFWPADVHVVGKDILRFHAVYWPAFLMSAGIELPRKVLSHGWWLMGGQKMSKTRGNTADPRKLVEWFGADAVRWFLLREITLGADGSYSDEALLDRLNSDLANDYGNTLSRITRIVDQSLGGRVPTLRRGGPLAQVASESWRGWTEGFDALDPQAAMEAAWRLLDATNKYLVAEEPWQLAKDPEARGRLDEVMHESAEAMRHVAAMVAPVMPAAARETFRRLGLEDDPFRGVLAHADGTAQWGFPEHGRIVHGTPLFPRIDKTSFFAGVRPDESGRTEPERIREAHAEGDARIGAAAASAGDATMHGVIAYEQFAAVALRAARVKTCRKHPDADKLLVLELEDGTETPRTVCAGIAAWYRPEDLVGRTVAIVANLAPRKLRGIQSQGMVLAASSRKPDGSEQVTVVELPGSVPPGSEIR